MSTSIETQPSDLSAPARDALTEMIASLADTKAALGRRYGEWAVSAPTLESGVAAAAMAQDELGHARSTYPLLTQLGVGSENEDRMDVQSSIPLLAQPLADWETFIAVNLIYDQMLTEFVSAATDSSFRPLAQRARKILQEEGSHQTHAAAWARRLLRDDRHADRFMGACTAVWEVAAQWPGDNDRYALLVGDSLVTGSPDVHRAAVCEHAASVARDAGCMLDLDTR